MQLDFNQNIILIGYPPNLLSEKSFINKTNTILENLTDFLFISIDDSNGFIKRNFNLHVLQEISSKDITLKEIEELLNKSTHSLIYWDGNNLSQFVYMTLLLKKPHKIIPVRLTTVVNKDRFEDYDVYIGRRGKWGNPFVIDKDGDRAQVIEKYEKYFFEEIITNPQKKQELLKLKGKVLGCHCKPHACHGDVIAKYLNSLDEEY